MITKIKKICKNCRFWEDEGSVDVRVPHDAHYCDNPESSRRKNNDYPGPHETCDFWKGPVPEYFYPDESIDLPDDRWGRAIVSGYYEGCQRYGEIVCAFMEGYEPDPTEAQWMLGNLERGDAVQEMRQILELAIKWRKDEIRHAALILESHEKGMTALEASDAALHSKQQLRIHLDAIISMKGRKKDAD